MIILVRPAVPETWRLLEEKDVKEEDRNEIEGLIVNQPDEVAAADKKEAKTLERDEENCLTCGRQSRKVSFYYDLT